MTRAVGVDVSRYDSTFNPTSFVEFVIMRASYSTSSKNTFEDQNFKNYYPNSLRVPVRGAYHYLSSWQNWKAQADKYLSIIDGKDIHFCVCDLEPAFNEMGKGYIAMGMEWLNYVKNVTKKKVVLYTNPSVYTSYINVYDKTRASLYDLWIAQYRYNYSNYQTAQPSMPKDRTNWSIWQFLPGEWGKFGYEAGVGRAGVDMDVFNGTLDEMKVWANSSGSTTPPDPDPKQFNVTASLLNVRTKATTQSNIVGGLSRGTTFFLIDTEGDGVGNVWGKIAEERYVALRYNGQYYTTWRA